MLSARKLVVPAGLFVLNLVPLVCSADEHSRMDNTHSTNTFKTHKVTPQLSYEIKLHGLLLWVSVGFFMPISILVKRMSNREASTTKLRIIFHIHATTQVVAVLVAAGGGIMSIKYLDNSFNNNHQRMGLVFFGLIWFQTLVSIFRPQRQGSFNQERIFSCKMYYISCCRGSKGRNIWFVFHWVVGIGASLLGIINIFTGLEAYHQRTSQDDDVRIWKIIFMVEMFFIIFIYLLQEKWHYIKKQGKGMLVPPTPNEDINGNII